MACGGWSGEHVAARTAVRLPNGRIGGSVAGWQPGRAAHRHCSLAPRRPCPRRPGPRSADQLDTAARSRPRAAGRSRSTISASRVSQWLFTQPVLRCSTEPSVEPSRSRKDRSCQSGRAVPRRTSAQCHASPCGRGLPRGQAGDGAAARRCLKTGSRAPPSVRVAASGLTTIEASLALLACLACLPCRCDPSDTCAGPSRNDPIVLDVSRISTTVWQRWPSDDP